MTPPVVVIVPAHDEEASVAAAIMCIRRSLADAEHRGLVSRTWVEVVAHRCTDATAVVARTALHPGPPGQVTLDETSTTIGQVRDLAVRRGLEAVGDGRTAWVLSTDADTRVGPTWVADVLAEAGRFQAEAVVGLAPLDGWQGRPAAAGVYARLVESRMRRIAAHHEHDHVYGANLAVRANAYLTVGGFPHVASGEDQAIVDALVAKGRRIVRTTSIAVVTSGRLRGRAQGGLADRLSLIDAAVEPAG